MALSATTKKKLAKYRTTIPSHCKYFYCFCMLNSWHDSSICDANICIQNVIVVTDYNNQNKQTTIPTTRPTTTAWIIGIEPTSWLNVKWKGKISFLLICFDKSPKNKCVKRLIKCHCKKSSSKAIFHRNRRLCNNLPD